MLGFWFLLLALGFFLCSWSRLAYIRMAQLMWSISLAWRWFGALLLGLISCSWLRLHNVKSSLYGTIFLGFWLGGKLRWALFVLWRCLLHGALVLGLVLTHIRMAHFVSLLLAYSSSWRSYVRPLAYSCLGILDVSLLACSCVLAILVMVCLSPCLTLGLMLIV